MSSSARVSAAPISRGTLLMYFAAVALLFMPTRLRSQGASDAGWNAGSGNWGTQGNWLCDIAGSVNNPQPCVPNGNFLVGLNNGQVTLDLNISVLDVESQVNGTLTLNGTSLTTTLGAVAALGGLTLTGGASITANTVVDTQNLVMQGSTITALTTGVTGFSAPSGSASITQGSNVNSLGLFGALTLDDSTVGGGGINITGPSSIFASTFNGGVVVDQGATLSVDNLSTINSNTVVVGSSSSGTLDLASSILNVNSGTVSIGVGPGQSTLTVSALSILSLNNSAISVGDARPFLASGQGILTVESGSSITSLGTTSIDVGSGAPGSAANGQMSVLTGGSVSVMSLNVGNGALGTIANVTVDGTNSQVKLSNGLVQDGGTITLSNSGSMRTGQIIEMQTGQLMVETAATLASGANVVIGTLDASGNGTGSLTLQSGGTGSDQMHLVLGNNAGSNGTMNIIGAGTIWNSTQSVNVGYRGAGTLNIQEGGVLTSGPDSNGISGLVGVQPGGTGTVTIDGTGSAWNQTGAIRVGDAGMGTVTIQNEGVLSTGSDGSIENLSGVVGVQSGGQGTVTVTGDNSEWQAGGNVQVGASGIGTLNIMDSGKVSADDLSVGADAGGQGTVSMNGGTLELAGKLTVGDAGQGTLTVVPAAPDDEGDITSMEGSIGAQIGSSGSVTIGSAVGQGIQATSSQWTVKGELVIGEAGSGTLDIGGNVTDLSSTIGKESTGNGTVTVENGGMWTTTNDLTVGDNGIGNLNIQTGGIAIVQFGQGVDVGSKSGSMGTVDVQGAWNMTQGLTIGSLGTGTMTIEGGGAVASGDGDIGLGPGSKGTVMVTGSGTTWSVDGTLAVGEGGTGTLNIVNGGLVLSRDGIIGKDSGGVGVVTVSGAGSQWKATLTGGTGTITVGGTGTGTLNVMGGGQVIATSVVVNPTGTLNGQGGMIVANLVNNGGVISPGDATGTLMVTGNYTQNTGGTMFEIDGPGPGQFDQLIISGLASFNGGTIDINFANNFLPTAGEDFALISALSLSNLGVTVDVTGLPAGFVFAENFTSTGFDLFTQQTPGGAPTPEPSTWLLLTSGLTSLAARLGSRRKKTLRPGGAGKAWL